MSDREIPRRPKLRLSRLGAARERLLLRDALLRHRGHCTDAAQALGLSRRALYARLKAHDLLIEASVLRAGHGIGGPRLGGIEVWEAEEEHAERRGC